MPFDPSKSSHPLVRAAGTGNTQEVTRLLDAGADCEARDDKDRSALQAASYCGQLAVITELIRRGAAVNAANKNGYTALHAASRWGHVDVTRVLLQAGADPATATIEGFTALHVASQRGHVDVTRVLLQAGADPAAATIEGGTALYMASQEGHVDVTRVLLQAGADPATATIDGVTALHVASGRGHLVVASTLLQAGADINALTTDGMTPLMWAAADGRVGTVNLLLQRGSDTLLKDSAGRTALMRAEKNGHTEVVHLLKLHARGEKLPPIVTQPGDQASPSTDTKAKFKFGNDHTQTHYSNLDKKRLADMCVMRILTAGDVEAGKSSLVLSLLNNQSYLTGKADRTEVMDYWNWAMPSGKVVSIYDIGGHPSYYYTAQFFHHNSPNNTILLCHALLSETYKKTFQWIQAIVSRSPRCHIIPVLTKADHAESDVEKEERKNMFVKKLQELLDGEIEYIDVLVQKLLNKREEEETKSYETLRRKYTGLKKTFKDVLVTSAKTINDKGIRELKERIDEMSATDENTVHVFEEFKEFYAVNGVMGVETEDPVNLIKNIAQKSKPVDFSGLRTSGADQVKPKEEKAMSQTKIPVGPNQSGIQRSKAKIVYFKDAAQVYQRIAKHNPELTLESCLSCLHSFGMLLWFDDNDVLRQIIFNDVGFFKDILKAIFHHNSLESIQFESLSIHLKSLFENNNDFEKQVNKLTSQGIMSQKILQVLLSESKFNDAKFIIEMLQKLNVAYKMPSTHEETLFVPYYVRQTQPPKHVLSIIDGLHISSKKELAVVLNIAGNMPSTFWHHICVLTLKKLEVNENSQERLVFVNHLWATLDEIYLHMKFQEGRDLTITMRCTVDDRSVICNMWKHLKSIQESVTEIKDNWWPGIITVTNIDCPHCIILVKIDNKSNSHFSPTLEEKDNTFKCGREPNLFLPAALIRPLATDNAVAERQLCHLRKFLDKRGVKKDLIETFNQKEDLPLIPVIEDLEDKTLNDLASHCIGNQWKRLGYKLGYNLTELENIEANNQSNRSDMITDMLIKWKQRQVEEPQISTLYNALKQCGYELKSEQSIQDLEEVRIVIAEPGPNVAPPTCSRPNVPPTSSSGQNVAPTSLSGPNVVPTSHSGCCLIL